MTIAALSALLACLLMYRSAARFDAAHPYEEWTARDREFARTFERDRNHALLSR